MLSLFITSLAIFEYVLVSGPVPNFIPPKYLTTINNMWSKLFAFNWFRMGNPAVFDGSLSSSAFVSLSNI